MPNHFLCCLPLRFGVFVLTFFSTIIGLLGAGGGWYLLHLLLTKAETEVPRNIMIGVIVFAVVFTLLALISFLGIVGVFAKKAGLLSTFNVLMIVHFVLSLIGGIFSLVVMIRNRNGPACQVGIELKDQLNCNPFSNTQGVSQGAYIGVYSACTVIGWLIELYLIAVVRSYIRFLKRGEPSMQRAGYADLKHKGEYDSVPLTQAHHV